MSPSKSPRLRVVVDGSNFATEGRTTPSLVQLDEAVRAFLEENPTAEVIVVADASFAHRVATSERTRFKESELAGEIVTPPAGAVGRGDAFILKIADRIKGVVLSNDSFQEFHDEYRWLFDTGRLIGGKPVPGVGWVFTPRLPVRAAKTAKVTKKLAVTLPNGAKPTIGTTLTPLKVPRVAKKSAAKPAAVKPRAAKKSPVKPASLPATKRPSKPAVEQPAKKVAVKKTSTNKAPLKKQPTKTPVKKVAKNAPPEVVLRRGRQPVNPEKEFTVFRSTHRLGARVEGEVTAFTSHGAVIQVELKGGGHVECYAPTTLLGSPAPTRARDVLTRGDRRSFRLANVDGDRRIAELSLS